MKLLLFRSTVGDPQVLAHLDVPSHVPEHECTCLRPNEQHRERMLSTSSKRRRTTPDLQGC